MAGSSTPWSRSRREVLGRWIASGIVLAAGCAGIRDGSADTPSTTAAPGATASGGEGTPRSPRRGRPDAIRPGDWPAFQYDRGNTGSTDAVVAASDPVEGWVSNPADGPSEFVSSPLVGYGLVFVGGVVADSARGVFALDRRTGAPAWSAPVGDATMRSMALAGETLVASDRGSGVYGIDVHSGAIQWEREAPSTSASPAVAGDVAYVASEGGDGRLAALDADDGAVRWTYRPGAGAASPREVAAPAVPAIARGLLYLPHEDPRTGRGSVHAVDVTDGERRWRTEVGGLDGGVAPSVATDGTRVYVQGADGTVAAFAADDGALAWQTGTDAVASADSRPGIALSDARVVAAGGTTVAGLRKRTGDVAFSRDLGDRDRPEPVRSAPTIARGTVLVCGRTAVYGLDASTGDARWRYELGAYPWGEPAVARGHLYLGTAAGRPSALRDGGVGGQGSVVALRAEACAFGHDGGKLR